jgi:hypothetical protein
VSASEFPGDETLLSSLDIDGSEYIDESEAPQGGPPPHGKPDPEAMLKEFDSDGDGSISESEAHLVPPPGGPGDFAEAGTDQ